MSKKAHYRRPKQPRTGKNRLGRGKAEYARPKIDPGLRPLFRKIGVPEPRPFTPDPFQVEAVELIRRYDVLVSAPTGSGKTWIASQAIRSYLSDNLRVWYASPLKALSNSIYQEFCRDFSPHCCGILTGDRKENPDAPVIVGTTEILRNQLYDAMHTGMSVRTDLVILDEAHYLSDPERGVVWEEVLIYLPQRVRLLLLSATISNPEEVCAWLREIRGSSNRVVRSEERPVPLEALFLFPDGLMVSLGRKKGLNLKVKKFLESTAGRKRRGRTDKIDFGGIIRCLRELNLLPAIFFLKSRADCDQALPASPPVSGQGDTKRRIKATLKAFLKDYPHLEGHRQIRFLLDSMVGSHHGGQLPYWKVLLERIMNMGLLDAIFSTSTVAAGVNFPARTVVIMQSDRYNGHEFADLSATDLHQMIGRSGRRGKDNIGFAVVVPGPYQKPQLINELQDSPSDPILSQIRINFSMTLNLLLSHTPVEVKDLLERSFAAFQEKGSGFSFEERFDQSVSGLQKALPEAKCDTTDPYEVLENIRERFEIQKALARAAKTVTRDVVVKAHEEYLRPGRLFLHKNGNIYVIFKTYTDNGRLVCASHNIRKRDLKGRRQLRLKRVDLNQIKTILDYSVDLPESLSREELDRLFDAIPQKGLGIINIEISDKDSGAEEVDRARAKSRSLPCEGCKHLTTCHGKKRGNFKKLLEEFSLAADRMEGSKGELWLDFKLHLRFLKQTGFVDEKDRLTSDGEWASNLRLDQPLLIAEAIKNGAFERISPELLAGALAPFVWDRAKEVGLRAKGILDLTAIENVFHKVLEEIEEIRALKKKQGFQDPPLMFWPAAALFMWAKGVPWDRLMDFVSVTDGDMVSLIMRTADHLRQVADLNKTHAKLASTAAQGVELILREPVYIP